MSYLLSRMLECYREKNVKSSTGSAGDSEVCRGGFTRQDYFVEMIYHRELLETLLHMLYMREIIGNRCAIGHTEPLID